MINFFLKFEAEKIAGLLFVVLIHLALLYSAWSYKLITPPEEAVTLFVHFINPSVKQEATAPLLPKPLPPKKVKLDKPKPIQRTQPLPIMVAEAPVTSTTEYIKPTPELIPSLSEETTVDEHVEDPVQSFDMLPKPSGTLMMASELSLGCQKRTPPNYPTASRRAGEQGRVVLQVELDKTGRIDSVKVKESSGYKRLDDAGLSALKSWQCNAAMRDGEAVRATALQPFDFILN